MRFLIPLFLLSLTSAAIAEVSCPTVIVVISCKSHVVVDKDGHPKIDQNGLVSYDWDLAGSSPICKREEVLLEEAAVAVSDSAVSLNPDFSDKTQCAHVAAGYAVKWEGQHPGRHVWSVGCPTPIVNEGLDGSQTIIGYQLPPCPNMLKCEEDSAI